MQMERVPKAIRQSAGSCVTKWYAHLLGYAQ